MKLSVITINLNNKAGLEKTLASVLAQMDQSFEYIIIDGGSTDGSVELIESYKDQFKNIPLTVISEPDQGIYHAMNKGIALAKGEYLHFLNSGDWLVDDTVVSSMLAEMKPNTQILLGKVIKVGKNGKKKKNINNKDVSLFTFYRGTIQHTSAYIKRSLFDEYGSYDESLKIVSDWKWYLQVVGLHQIKVDITDTYVTYFNLEGISSTNKILDKQERRKVLEELLPPAVLHDYDRYHFDILQMKRLKRYPVIYKMVWFVERVLFKWEKSFNK